MPSDDPLVGLRALHLPAETSSFWSDVGFAAALGLVLALLVVYAVRALFRPRRSLRASALDAFAEAQAMPPDRRRAAQAALLRRVVRSVEGDEASRATGASWSATLDRVFGTDLFSARAGQIFADGLYARPVHADADDPELDRELGALLQKLKR